MMFESRKTVNRSKRGKAFSELAIYDEPLDFPSFHNIYGNFVCNPLLTVLFNYHETISQHLFEVRLFFCWRCSSGTEQL